MAHPDELNPNHPVTREISDNWHKIAALILWKLSGYDHKAKIEITLADMAKLPPDVTIVVHSHEKSMDVKLVDAEEGDRLIREAGGLVI